MELILEILFELIVEGSVGAVGDKKVPMVVRVLAASFLILIFGGLIALFIVIGINDQSWVAFVFAGLIAVIVFLAVMTTVKKHRK